MVILNLLVSTGLFNYYTSFLMEPGSEAMYEVYALESTGPHCEGYYLQWNISMSPYSVSFEVKKLQHLSNFIFILHHFL